MELLAEDKVMWINPLVEWQVGDSFPTLELFDVS